MTWLTEILPEWFLNWFRIYGAQLLKLQVRELAKAMFLGAIDAVLLFTLPITISTGSQTIWNARYHLTPTQQQQVETWADIAQAVAYLEDVPPVVPLVLWMKESGLQTTNPDNCEGIMGLHSAVVSGELPCFTPGDIGPAEVAAQLRIGARTFKSYCPEITYTTTNPYLIKRCYLYYNAGPRSRMRPEHSAYVMNGYDAAHENMILTDVKGRQYKLTALGAWPSHLAIQAQLANRDRTWMPKPLMAPMMLIQEVWDRLWTLKEASSTKGEVVIGEPTLNDDGIVVYAPGDVSSPPTSQPPVCIEIHTGECFTEPAAPGDPPQRPHQSPLLLEPLQVGEPQCGLLPSVEITASASTLILAPMDGTLIRYADQNGNLTVQIENETWTVWLTGLRSYTAREGPVFAGDPVGAIGGVNTRTPSIHYTVYDRLAPGFVDARAFLPSFTRCPEY